jgi:nitrogen fixation/metabolism regulation signal transduction histidine kinase
LDINLFRTEGKLWLTSNSRIYKDGLFAPYINPIAFDQLSRHHRFNISQFEKFGSLKYLSSYNAFFNDQHQLSGFISLPYFSQSIDHNKELAGFLSSLINAFTIMLVLTLVLAGLIGNLLTKPLKMLGLSFSKLNIGAKNEPIFWQYKDELGNLISQYNEMVRKLENSTNQLAQREREGAWREMAKQVAHEIKNPLTPMKLNLQHLQMLVKRGDTGLASRIDEISQMLVDQIDQMAKMAEEFSSFAKMPKPEMGLFDVHLSLDHCIKLMQGLPGRESVTLWVILMKPDISG